MDYYYTYESCMEAAGAVVYDSASFGSYEGSSVALVTYNGVTGFVFWGFGSCGGCDALEGWRDDVKGQPTREQAAAFGVDYLSEILTYGAAITRASKHAGWSSEDAEMLEWVRKMEETYKKVSVKKPTLLPPVEDDN